MTKNGVGIDDFDRFCVSIYMLNNVEKLNFILMFVMAWRPATLIGGCFTRVLNDSLNPYKNET